MLKTLRNNIFLPKRLARCACVFLFPAFFLSFSFLIYSSVFILFFSDMCPLKTEKLSYLRAQASILRSLVLSVKEISKLLNKSVRWVVKWSAREEFEDQARTGRPAVLTKEAKRVIKKAKYKRGSSTSKMSQQIQSKGFFRFKIDGMVIHE